MKNSLYQINGALIALFEQIEENGGELTEELGQQLEIKENELTEKANGYLEIIGDQESFIARIDEEVKRLQARKKQAKSVVDRLKNNLVKAVEVFGEIDLDTKTVTTRKSTVVNVDNVNSLPDVYKVKKVTEAADKAAIKKDLKAGVEIDGCQLVENRNLKIK